MLVRRRCASLDMVTGDSAIAARYEEQLKLQPLIGNDCTDAQIIAIVQTRKLK